MSLVIFAVILSIMIVVHELGHLIVAKRLGMQVDKFSLGFGKSIFSFTKGGTEYAISMIPFGGYVKLAGFSENERTGKNGDFLAHPVWQRASVIFFGPFVNYLFAFLCFWLIFFLGFPRLTSVVGSVVEKLPAQVAGITAGDKIVKIDGKEIAYWDELQETILDTKKDLLGLSIKRGENIIELNVPVEKTEVDDIFGKKHTLKVIGVKSSNDFIQVKYNVFTAFGMASVRLYDLTKLTYSGIWWLFSGKVSFKDSVTGPIGIYDMTKNVVKLGFVAILHLMGVLSLSLALFNLLPFPVLDGGHIFLLFIEKIRAKRLSQKLEDAINNVGLTFIVLVGIFVFYNDLVRFGHIEKITNLVRDLIK